MGPFNSGSENMALNKRGIFFTLAAVTMVLFLILSLPMFLTQERSQKTPVLSRIRAMNNFVKDVEKDLDRELRISGFRALLGMQEYVASNGNFLNNSREALKSALANGTIETEPLSIMQDSSLEDWAQKVRTQAANINVDLNVTLNSLEVYHTSPWSIEVRANVSFSVVDNANVASWRFSQINVVEVSILGMEDPLYTVATYNRVVHVINITPYEGNYVSGTDTTNLMDHTTKGFYANSTGPSFLMRFEGNLSNSTFGIESLVNVPYLETQGIPVKQKSVVDYIYFSNESPAYHRINNTPDWFYLDDAHLEKYQISDDMKLT